MTAAASTDCEDTVLIEVTYCGYSHVVPDLVATRIAARVGAR